MSQENVEIVRGLFKAWNAGDWDAYGALLDPKVILRTAEDWPEPGPYVGRDEVVRQFQQMRETFEDADAVKMLSVVDTADRVVVRIAWRGTGQGPDMNMEITGVYTVRNGKNLLQEFFWDHAEALEAIGLSQ